jgi:hypothetical protein
MITSATTFNGLSRGNRLMKYRTPVRSATLPGPKLAAADALDPEVRLGLVS